MAEIHANRPKVDGQDFVSKILSGLSNASTSISDGLDGAAEKSIEGIKKATVEGGKAAGEAIGRTATSAGGAVLKEGKTIVREASKASEKAYKYLEKSAYRGLDKIEQSVGVEDAQDFISSFNPSELPAVTSLGGGIGGMLAGREELKENTTKVINYIKLKIKNERNN